MAMQEDTQTMQYKQIRGETKLTTKYKMADLFSGIGTFHFASKELDNIEVVYAADINKQAINFYKQYHNMDSFNDLTIVDTNNIPDIDIVCGGSPCQDFSMAGSRKGFEGTRGTLFFDYARIIKDKQPKAFIFENVKGLTNHNKGNTYKIIKQTLIKCGYTIYCKVLDALDYGSACRRERVFIVGYRNDLNVDSFEFPLQQTRLNNVYDYIDKSINQKTHPHLYKISPCIQKKIDEYMHKRILKQNEVVSYCYKINSTYGYTPTLTTGITNLPMVQDKTGTLRLLTPTECFNIMGFRINLNDSISDNQYYKLIGNAISCDVARNLLSAVLEALD